MPNDVTGLAGEEFTSLLTYAIILFYVFQMLVLCIPFDYQSYIGSIQMLHRFRRSPNSEKYEHKMEIEQDSCFDLTLADMDIGIYQPMHQQIIKNLQKLEAEISKASLDKKAILSIHLKYQNQARSAIVQWYNLEYKCKIKLQSDKISEREEFVAVKVFFCPSIVSLCSYSIMAFTQPQDSILVMTPVYSSYFNIISKLKRRVALTFLIYRRSNQIKQSQRTVFGNKVGNFFIDFQNMEKVIEKESVKMLILSHPHNPSGRVWSQSEIKNILAICKKRDVIIVSDEILADLTFVEKNRQFYSVARELKQYQNVLIANSVSKSFNYSSIQGGYAFTPDPNLQKKLNKIMVQTFQEDIDQFAVCAIIGCLNRQGRIWLAIIREIINRNYIRLLTFKQCRAPLLEIALLEAAYLVYLDLSAYFVNSNTIKKLMATQNIQVMQLGSNYLPYKQGSKEIRICIACQQQHFQRFLLGLNIVLTNAEKMKEKAKL